MAGGGWIKIYRSIQDHWIWDNPVYLKWWLDLLLMANHKPNDVLVNGKVETIDVGERLTSEIKLSERWNVDRKTVRRFLNLLEKEQMITLTKSRQKGTTVKVLKYSDYQQFSEVSRDNKKDIKVYNGGDIARDNGRDINKNEKNDKNEKNIHDDGDGAMKEIFQLYEKTFGVLNSVNVQSLQYWCEDLSPELLVEALKRSKGSRSFKYTEGILKKWEAKGVKNMDDVQALDTEFEKSKSGYKNKRSTPEDELPETGLEW
ncbi:DnaD domain protein [Enterococcus hulanensis]|uniref:DnaD domain protein n=1 Tax=Enterococcus hulanensis TaxID=2559929 RepID=UPI001A908A41|nr:DnaD domain protein [Enterococcus hulanensis]MBO0456317.1 DnaD domain protein [Enterococcus hulanensis]